MSSSQALLSRHSFVELDARGRVRALVDQGRFRELIDPFERLSSPWLARQGVVPQSDDGVVVAKAQIGAMPVVVLAIEGGFQGGSLGEVGGAKIAGALELAAADNRRGTPTRAVILFETGGVRLQEANLGLAAIADIHAAIVDLRRYQPVVGVIAGSVGCFGGMSIAAGLCSHLVVTREARLGLNGPQVIEQEAGVLEYDSRDRPFIWRFTGGEQRHRSGLVDAYVDDDADALRDSVTALLAQGRPAVERSDAYQHYLERLSHYDPSAQATPELVRSLYQPAADSAAAGAEMAASVANRPPAGGAGLPLTGASPMAGAAAVDPAPSGRGARWLAALTAATAVPLAGYPASLRVVDGELAGQPCRYISVLPDPANPYPRARNGEVGLIEGWALAQAVHQVIATDRDGRKRAIVAVVDISSQAYGRREEALGIHQALAGAAGAYASARLAGHPVIALLVGKAMSGAFLAHGYQANRLIALNDNGVMVHAMGQAAAARVTMRSVGELQRLAADVPPLAYDIVSFASLGLLWRLLDVRDADHPDAHDLDAVRAALVAAWQDIQHDAERDLRSRLGAANREASTRVRERLVALW